MFDEGSLERLIYNELCLGEGVELTYITFGDQASHAIYGVE